MARMTKQAAKELLKNRKVYVNGKGAEIRKALFEIGFEWNGACKEIANTCWPFIYTGEKYFVFGDDMDDFTNDSSEEISAEEILAIEIEPECPFKPFDRVLVRASNVDIWRAAIFSHYLQEYQSLPPSYFCVGGLWAQCVHYEGNESLLGTNDKPKGEL